MRVYAALPLPATTNSGLAFESRFCDLGHMVTRLFFTQILYRNSLLKFPARAQAKDVRGVVMGHGFMLMYLHRDDDDDYLYGSSTQPESKSG
jgi:hypothetical protein